MKKLNTLPINDGFSMPGEFSPHEGCIVIWPERTGSWIYGAKNARIAFKNVIEEIAKSEKVIVIASKKSYNSAKEELPKHIEILVIETDDAWARDTAPTFVVKNGLVRGINWQFNAWGGKFDGLYSSWDKDNLLAENFCKQKNIDMYDASHFVLEGGAIHSDGEGTVITTESCLLSKGRNPNMTKEQVEDNLKNYLGAKKIIWLPDGIYNDETNGHVDNVCAFVAPGKMVLAWTDDKNDPQYEMSVACLNVLENTPDAKGRKIEVHKMYIPDHPVCINEYEYKGFLFEEGEDKREIGERLAASYINFYFSNDAVILPQFGGENENSDKKAVKLMEFLCKDRKIVPVYARDIIVGGGNIHCITQQIPKGAKI